MTEVWMVAIVVLLLIVFALLLRGQWTNRRVDHEVKTQVDSLAMSRVSKLTERELEVARLAAQGSQEREIAQRLHISRNTVATHLRNTYRKLGIHTRLDLLAVLEREGLLENESRSNSK